MGLPRVAEARLYYRAAKHRLVDAQLLLDADRTTGAMYLAGYAVECFLKSLLLASVAPDLRRTLLDEFPGRRGHDLELLGSLYRRHVVMDIPTDVTRHLSRVAMWSTDLRYATGVLKAREAKRFMNSVTAITDWIDGRL